MTTETSDPKNADVAATITPTETEPKTPTGNTVPKDRFEGVIAEKNRTKDENEKLKAQIAELQEKSKTELERERDAYADEKVKPIQAELDKANKYFTDRAKVLMEKVPEERQPHGFDDLPAFQQFEVARTLHESQQDATTVTIGDNANPSPPAGKKVWHGTEIGQLSQDREWWKANKDEIAAAEREGRVLYDK